MLLATPNCMDVLPPKSENQTKNHKSRPGRTRSGNLREQIAYNQYTNLIQTMTVFDSTSASANMKSTQVKEGSMHSMTLSRLLLPTPNASDNRDRGGPKDKCVQRRIEIGKQVGLTQLVDGRLNPRFTLQMMGFPPDWTLKPFQKKIG